MVRCHLFLFCLAQNFANDASKSGQEYAQEGLKQGQKLGEQAYELGKDKGNIDFASIMNDNDIFSLFICS